MCHLEEPRCQGLAEKGSKSHWNSTPKSKLCASNTDHDNVVYIVVHFSVLRLSLSTVVLSILYNHGLSPL